jgi:hypothetical protein
MRRATLWSLAATLSFSQAVAFAQSGALSGVTMRVLDDLSGVDAVVLQLDANPAAANPAAAEPGAEAESAAPTADDAARARASRDEPSAEPRAANRERADLHDTAIDERSEGRLEDRDVEQRAVAAPASP